MYYSKAPIIRTGHSAVLAVHICTAELAYVPVRIIGTLEYISSFLGQGNVKIGSFQSI